MVRHKYSSEQHGGLPDTDTQCWSQHIFNQEVKNKMESDRRQLLLCVSEVHRIVNVNFPYPTPSFYPITLMLLPLISITSQILQWDLCCGEISPKSKLHIYSSSSQEFSIVFTFTSLCPWADLRLDISHSPSYGPKETFWQPEVPSMLQSYSLTTFAQKSKECLHWTGK